MAWRVIRLQAMTNFFWNPPLPWSISSAFGGTLQLDATSPHAASSVLQKFF
jgi:hypothetical protein